jgi:hypothetical protein
LATSIFTLTGQLKTANPRKQARKSIVPSFRY